MKKARSRAGFLLPWAARASHGGLVEHVVGLVTDDLALAGLGGATGQGRGHAACRTAGAEQQAVERGGGDAARVVDRVVGLEADGEAV